MAVTPTGAPVWVRTNDHTTYGGNVNKRNYQSQGSVNAQTDISAEEYVRVCADLDAIGRVSPFAMIHYTNNDTVPAVPTVNNYDAMVGSAPTGVRNGDGDVTFTWSASYNDPYSQAGTIHIVSAVANVNSSAAEFCTVVPLDGDVDTRNEQVRVRAFDAAGAAIQDADVMLIVWTGA